MPSVQLRTGQGSGLVSAGLPWWPSETLSFIFSLLYSLGAGSGGISAKLDALVILGALTCDLATGYAGHSTHPDKA